MTDSDFSSIEQGPLRPPSESHSLLVRVVRNCHWNQCAFCPAFKGEPFSKRPLAEVLAEIDVMTVQRGQTSVTTVFLQDADALCVPIPELETILLHIRNRFPRVSRITAYSRSRTLANRSVGDLKRLKTAGLSRIHVGVESGSDEVLQLMNKGVSSELQKEGCFRVKQAELELCCYFMPGLGGKELSLQHVRDSAMLLSAVSPDHIRLRTSVVIEKTPLADLLAGGLYQPLEEVETVEEIRSFLEQLKVNHSEIISDHRINLLLELRGRLPEEHSKLLEIIDRFLIMTPEEKEYFIVGRRTGLIKIMDELKNPDKKAAIAALIPHYQVLLPVPRSLLY